MEKDNDKMEKEALITAVRERNVIWDATNKDYQNRFVLSNCWNEVGKIVGLPASEASNQWKNLIQEFKRHWEKAKSHMPEGTSAHEISIPWRYFKSMRFIINQIESKKKKSKISGEDNADSLLYDDGVRIIKKEPSLTNEPIPDDLQEYMSIPGSAQSDYDIGYMDAAIPTVEYEHNDAKRRKLEENYDENDEDIGFFNSLLPHVKKLSAKNKLIFRMKSQNLLFDLLYGDKSQEKNSNSKMTDNTTK